MRMFERGTAALRFSFWWAAGLEQADAEADGAIREFVHPCNEQLLAA